MIGRLTNILKDIGMIIPFIWLMFSTTRGFGVLKSRDFLREIEFDAMQGAAEGYVFLGLILIGLWILHRYGFRWYCFVKENKLLCLLYLMMFLSCLWSQFQFLSFKRCIKTFGVIVMVNMLIYNYDKDRIMKFLEIFIIVNVLMSLIYIFLFPELGIGKTIGGEVEIVGITHSKNSLAQILLAGIMIFGFNMLNSEKRFLYFVLGIMCLVMTYYLDSVTCLLIGLVVWIVMLCYLLFTKVFMDFKAEIIWSTVLFAVLGITFFTMTSGRSLVEGVFEGVGRDMTLTGRVDLWVDVFHAASPDWILGKGYGAFWVEGEGNDLWETYIWQPNQAHMGYLDIYVELGVIGFVMFICWLATVLKEVPSMLFYGGIGIFRVICIVGIVIHNFVETSFLHLNQFYWFLFLLVCFIQEFRTCRPKKRLFSNYFEQLRAKKM